MRHAGTTRLLAWTFLLSVLTPRVATQAQSGATAVVLQGARLIDGAGRPPLADSVLVIERGMIRAVGEKGSVQYPKGASVVDVRGKTIMPALINLHGHLGLTRGIEQDGRNYSEENIRGQMECYLSYGVGTVLSLGTDQELIYSLRDARHHFAAIAKSSSDDSPLNTRLRETARTENLKGMRLYTAGRGFGAPGGYPPPVPNAEDRYRPQTPDEARTDVRELAAHHPDFVKIWVDDDFGRVPKMRPEIYRAIIDEAHRQHLRVIAHVFYLEDAQDLVDAGIDGLGHSVRDRAVDTRLIAAMKARRVFYIPTLVRDESTFIFAKEPQEPKWLDDPFFQRGLQPGVLDTLRSAGFIGKIRANPNLAKYEAGFEMAKKNLRTLFDAGVEVALGTDSGPPLRFQSFFEHRELQLMVESGLMPTQAIECATRNAALILGVNDEFGTLEAGRGADFLVLRADPLEDIHNTEKLSAVWLAGTQVFAWQ